MSDGICAPCVTACCPWRCDMVLGCSHYTPKSETNYERLFGTPERAARTLLDACDNCAQNECSGCQVYELTSGGDLGYDALLEWLSGDA